MWLCVIGGTLVCVIEVIPGALPELFLPAAFSRKERFSEMTRGYLFPRARDARMPAEQSTTEIVKMSFALFRKSE